MFKAKRKKRDVDRTIFGLHSHSEIDERIASNIYMYILVITFVKSKLKIVLFSLRLRR